MIVLHWVLAIVRFILLITLMALLIFCYLISLIFVNHTVDRAFGLRRIWVNLAIWILGIQIERMGEPIRDVGLYVSNHRSFTDPVIVAKYLNTFVIAKAEVRQMPVIHWGARLTGVIYVNRKDKSSRKASRNVMVETLKKGYNVLVYPEGTVGSGATCMRFKTGTFREASTHHFPVIPVAIEYSSQKDLWDSGSVYHQFMKQFGKPCTRVKLVFGKPLQSESASELVYVTKRFIDESLGNMQKNWSEVYG